MLVNVTRAFDLGRRKARHILWAGEKQGTLMLVHRRFPKEERVVMTAELRQPGAVNLLLPPLGDAVVLRVTSQWEINGWELLPGEGGVPPNRFYRQMWIVMPVLADRSRPTG